MRQPTEKDIEAAKAYLRQRIECERAMSVLLENAMKEAAERIVEICYAANVNPQTFRYADLPLRAQWDIDEVIQRLQEEIDDYFLTLAIADHEENRDKILPFILGENHGMTFEERLSDYCGKYKNELLLLIGAGLFLGIEKSALVKSIGENLKHPYANQMLAEGIEENISFGRGKYNSMFNNINRLCRFGISTAWMESQYISNRNKGCIGWLVQRGSSFPCSLCDEKVGFQAKEDNLPPFHANCQCYAVPIFL